MLKGFAKGCKAEGGEKGVDTGNDGGAIVGDTVKNFFDIGAKDGKSVEIINAFGFSVTRMPGPQKENPFIQ